MTTNNKVTYLARNGWTWERRPVEDMRVINIYNAVNEYMNRLNDDDFNAVYSAVDTLVWESGETRKRAYNKLYLIARRNGWKVSDFELWYCLDD